MLFTKFLIFLALPLFLLAKDSPEKTAKRGGRVSSGRQIGKSPRVNQQQQKKAASAQKSANIHGTEEMQSVQEMARNDLEATSGVGFSNFDVLMRAVDAELRERDAQEGGETEGQNENGTDELGEEAVTQVGDETQRATEAAEGSILGEMRWPTTTKKRRVYKSMSDIEGEQRSGQRGKSISEHTVGPSSFSERRGKERKTPKKAEAKRVAAPPNANGKGKEKATPFLGRGAKEQGGKRRGKKPTLANLMTNKESLMYNIPWDTNLVDLMAGRESWYDDSPSNKETPRSAVSEGAKGKGKQKERHQQQKRDDIWLPESHKLPLDAFVLNFLGQGEEGNSTADRSKPSATSKGKMPMADMDTGDHHRPAVQADADPRQRKAHGEGTSKMAESSSSTEPKKCSKWLGVYERIRERLKKGGEQFNDMASTASSTERANGRCKELQTKYDLESLVGRVGNMRVASSSSSANLSMSVDFSRDTTEELRPKTNAEIRESVGVAAAQSVKAIGLNRMDFGFFSNDIFVPVFMETENWDELVKTIIGLDDQSDSAATTTTEAISHLREQENALLNKVLDELREESAKFEDHLKLDLINAVEQQVADLASQKPPILLFTYVRLYRKLATALRWTLLNGDGNGRDQLGGTTADKRRKNAHILLKWLTTLADSLLGALLRKSEAKRFSFTAKWVQSLAQMEEAVELANFGILFLLPHGTWQFVGAAERPTMAEGLFEKIGRAQIFQQIDDASCDISCIEQMVTQKWALMDHLNSEAVLKKFKEIVNEMLDEVKQCNATTTNIKNLPSKILLFLGILRRIRGELAKPDFAKLLVPKLAKEKQKILKPKLVEERDNGLAFLEQCVDILGDKLQEYENGVQKELCDLSRLRKGRQMAKTKDKRAEGASADDPIEL